MKVYGISKMIIRSYLFVAFLFLLPTAGVSENATGEQFDKFTLTISGSIVTVDDQTGQAGRFFSPGKRIKLSFEFVDGKFLAGAGSDIRDFDTIKSIDGIAGNYVFSGSSGNVFVRDESLGDMIVVSAVSEDVYEWAFNREPQPDLVETSGPIAGHALRGVQFNTRSTLSDFGNGIVVPGDSFSSSMEKLIALSETTDVLSGTEILLSFREAGSQIGPVLVTAKVSEMSLQRTAVPVSQQPQEDIDPLAQARLSTEMRSNSDYDREIVDTFLDHLSAYVRNQEVARREMIDVFLGSGALPQDFDWESYVAPIVKWALLSNKEVPRHTALVRVLDVLKEIRPIELGYSNLRCFGNPRSAKFDYPSWQNYQIATWKAEELAATCDFVSLMYWRWSTEPTDVITFLSLVQKHSEMPLIGTEAIARAFLDEQSIVLSPADFYNLQKAGVNFATKYANDRTLVQALSEGICFEEGKDHCQRICQFFTTPALELDNIDWPLFGTNNTATKTHELNSVPKRACGEVFRKNVQEFPDQLKALKRDALLAADQPLLDYLSKF